MKGFNQRDKLRLKVRLSKNKGKNKKNASDIKNNTSSTEINEPPPPPPPIHSQSFEQNIAENLRDDNIHEQTNTSTLVPPPFDSIISESGNISGAKTTPPPTTSTLTKSQSKKFSFNELTFGAGDYLFSLEDNYDNGATSKKTDKEIEHEIGPLIKDLKKHPEQWQKTFTKICSTLPYNHKNRLKFIDSKIQTITFRLFNSSQVNKLLVFNTIGRLLRVKSLYKTIHKHGIDPLVQGLYDDNDKVAFAALKVSRHILSFKGSSKSGTLTELIQANKQLFYNSRGFDGLAHLLKQHMQACLTYQQQYYSSTPNSNNSNGSEQRNRLLPDSTITSIQNQKQSSSEQPERRRNPQILLSALEIFSSVLCSEADSLSYQAVVHIMDLLKRYITFLLQLSCSPNTAIAYHSSVLLQCLLLHSDETTHDTIQRSALRNGTFLKHLYIVLKGPVNFTYIPDHHKRMLEPIENGQCASRLQHESKMLIGLLSDGYQDAHQLLCDILPKRIVKINLDLPHKYEYKHFYMNCGGLQKKRQESSAFAKYSMKHLRRDNQHSVFDSLSIDVKQPDLIQNRTTFDELCECLKIEIIEFERQQTIMPRSDQNWAGFEVVYSSLKEEVQCAGYYIRLLLPALEQNWAEHIQMKKRQTATGTSSPVSGDNSIDNLDGKDSLTTPKTATPKTDDIITNRYKTNIPFSELRKLVNEIYNRAVIEDREAWKLGCLKLTSVLFRNYSKELKILDPLPYFVQLIDPKHTQPLQRDLILNFFATILTNVHNARTFVYSGGLDHLNYYISSIHAIKNKENCISSISIQNLTDYYDQNGKKIESPMSVNEVAQSSIALIRLLCQKLPHLKRSIPRHEIFQSLIHLLICDNQSIVSDTASLLLYIVTHNPYAIPRLVSTGLFIYLVYCMKSECSLDIAKLLHQFHNKQSNYQLLISSSNSDKSDNDSGAVEVGSEISIIQDNDSSNVSASVLEFMLPQTFIDVLANEGPEKFLEYMRCQKGDIVRPDLIQNKEMSAILFNTLNNIVGERKERLLHDFNARFQHKKHPKIQYPQIEQEVCVSGIYIRIFCQQTDFSLRSPLKFMQGLVDRIRFIDKQYSSTSFESQSDSHFTTHADKTADLHFCDNICYLLDSQVEMIRRFPTLLNIREYPCFEELFRLIKNRFDFAFKRSSKFDNSQLSNDDLRIINSTVELIQFLLILKTDSNNRRSCVSVKGVDHMAKFILTLIDGARLDSSNSKPIFENTKIRFILLKIISITSVLCLNDLESMKQLLNNNRLFDEFLILIEFNYARENIDICDVVLKFIYNLSGCQDLSRLFICNGTFLHVLNILLVQPMPENRSDGSKIAKSDISGNSSNSRVRSIASASSKASSGSNVRRPRPAALKILGGTVEKTTNPKDRVDINRFITVASYCFSSLCGKMSYFCEFGSLINNIYEHLGIKNISTILQSLKPSDHKSISTENSKSRSNTLSVSTSTSNSTNTNTNINFFTNFDPILKRLLTPGLFVLLEDPEEFFEVLRSDSYNPLLIQNNTLRNELISFIQQEIDFYTQFKRFCNEKTNKNDSKNSKLLKNFTSHQQNTLLNLNSSSNLQFTYSSLRHEILIGAGEIVVDDIYLRLYNEQFSKTENQDFSLPHGRLAFCKALIKALNKAITIEEKEEISSTKLLNFVCVVSSSLGRLLCRSPSLISDECCDELQSLSKILLTCAFNNTKNSREIELLLKRQEHFGILVFKCVLESGKCIEESQREILFDQISPCILIFHQLLCREDDVIDSEDSEGESSSSLSSCFDVLSRILFECSSFSTFNKSKSDKLMKEEFNVKKNGKEESRRYKTMFVRLLNSGILLTLLNIIMENDVYSFEQRVKAARVLGQLANNRWVGLKTRGFVSQMLTPEFDGRVVGADHSPRVLIEFLDQDHDTPLVYWNCGCRKDLREFLKLEVQGVNDGLCNYVDELVSVQSAIDEYGDELMRKEKGSLSGVGRSLRHQPQTYESCLSSPSNFFWNSQIVVDRFFKNTLSAELCIDSIYIHALNSNPYFPIDTDSFQPKLIDGMKSEFAFYSHIRDRLAKKIDSENKQINTNININTNTNNNSISSNTETSQQQSNEKDDEGSIEHAVANLIALQNTLSNLLQNEPSIEKNCVNILSYFFAYFDSKVYLPLQSTALSTVKLLTTNPECVEEIVKLNFVRHIFVLIVTFEDDKERLIDIMEMLMNMLRRNSKSVDQMRALGGLVLILNLVLQSKFDVEVRYKASSLISAMCRDNNYGMSIIDNVMRFVTSEFRARLTARPDLLIQMVDSDHKSLDDGRIWNSTVRKKLSTFLDAEAKRLAEIMPEWDGTTDIWDVSSIDLLWQNMNQDLENGSKNSNENEIDEKVNEDEIDF